MTTWNSEAKSLFRDIGNQTISLPYFTKEKLGLQEKSMTPEAEETREANGHSPQGSKPYSL